MEETVKKKKEREKGGNGEMEIFSSVRNLLYTVVSKDPCSIQIIQTPLFYSR